MKKLKEFKCPKCHNEMDCFVNTMELQAYECLECNVLLTVCYDPTRKTTKELNRVIEGIYFKNEKSS